MSAPPPVLRVLDDPHDRRWDRYVEGHPEGTPFHLLGWRRALTRAVDAEPQYLYVQRGEDVCGVLPAFIAGGRPFPRALVSVPIAVGGGILADDDAAARMLKDGARAIAEREKLAYVEYKCETARFDDLKTKSGLYFTFRQELFGDRDKQLAAIPRKTRALLRASERAGLTYEYNTTDLEPFYDFYALSLRNLGTPIWSKRLFEGLIEEMPGQCDFLTVRESGRIIAVVQNVYINDRMLPFFAGSAPEARDVGVNNYMYWAMLESGYDLGYRSFDFGRSKAGTGAFKFKKNFGMTPIELHYQYDMVGESELPQVNPTNPRYAKAIGMWQRLPVEVTKHLGPLIQRRMP